MGSVQMSKATVDITQKYHEQILGFLNTRISETFKFYAPILAAGAGFGLSISGPAPKPVVVAAAYFISSILLWGGAVYIFATSYTYRNFQLTLQGAESHMGLSWLTQRWHITSKLRRRYWENRLWVVPEILKPHLAMMAMTFAFITGLCAFWFFQNESSPGQLIYHELPVEFCYFSWLANGLWVSFIGFIVWQDHYFYTKLRNKALSEIIRERAYELAEKRGFVCGHEMEDWLKAESELR